MLSCVSLILYSHATANLKPALRDKAFLDNVKRRLSDNGACVPCFLMEKRLGDITLIFLSLSTCRNFRESDVVIGGTHGVSC